MVAVVLCWKDGAPKQLVVIANQILSTMAHTPPHGKLNCLLRGLNNGLGVANWFGCNGNGEETTNPPATVQNPGSISNAENGGRGSGNIVKEHNFSTPKPVAAVLNDGIQHENNVVTMDNKRKAA
jgi:hypothetical protein